MFMTIEDAKVLIEQCRKEYNQVHEHISLRYEKPAPDVILTSTVT